MQPLVSIIIPAYNAADYIADTIESALRQSYGNIEIIVVDDGSTDSTFNIAQRYENSGITVVKQINSGASAARNYGIALAKGQYIQFLDADDLLHEEKVEHQVETIEKYSDLQLVGGKWRRFDRSVEILYKAMPYTEEETRCFDKVEWLINRPYMVPHTWLVSKKLIALAGLWNEKLSFNDDGEFFYRIIAASNGIIINHRAVAYYRSGNASSLSNRRDREAMISWIESIRSYKKIVASIAGDKGNESVNKYFFELSYNCVNKFPDLLEECRAEMYYPDTVYNLSDGMVYHLSRIIGLSKAKRVREAVNLVRGTRAMAYLISKTKATIGWSSY